MKEDSQKKNVFDIKFKKCTATQMSIYMEIDGCKMMFAYVKHC